MRAFILTVLIALALALVAAAPAQAGFKSGNELWDDCHKGSSMDVAWGVCVGYITGVADTLAAPEQGKKTARLNVCLRESVTIGQLHDTVIKFMSDRPDLRDLAADQVVELALYQAYPC